MYNSLDQFSNPSKSISIPVKPEFVAKFTNAVIAAADFDGLKNNQSFFLFVFISIYKRYSLFPTPTRPLQRPEGME